jgi:hypothetical protein
MSILGFAGAAADRTDEADEAAVDVEAVGGTTDALEDMDGFPLTWPVAATGTVPKVFTPSDLVGGTAAGDEDIGAETSSIDPNVTAEPVYWRKDWEI